MLVGDMRKYLTCLVTLKVWMRLAVCGVRCGVVECGGVRCGVCELCMAAVCSVLSTLILGSPQMSC